MKDKNKLIITICLIGIIISLMALLVLKIIETNPKTQEQNQVDYAYKKLHSMYEADKEKSLVTDGRYTTVIIPQKGNELRILGEFDITTDKLIHLCISDGTKMLEARNENVTKQYLEENAKFERSTDTCEYDE